MKLLPILTGFFALILTSCYVEVGNPLTADAELDERLPGVWEPISGPEGEPVDETDGVDQNIVIEEGKDGFLRFMAQEDYEEGAELSDEIKGRTAARGGRHFLFMEVISGGGDGNESGPVSHQIAEYGFTDSGELFLNFIAEDVFKEEMVKVHRVPYTVGPGKLFPPARITATQEELLEFILDPAVGALMTRLGTFRRISP